MNEMIITIQNFEKINVRERKEFRELSAGRVTVSELLITFWWDREVSDHLVMYTVDENHIDCFLSSLEWAFFCFLVASWMVSIMSMAQKTTSMT